MHNLGRVVARNKVDPLLKNNLTGVFATLADEDHVKKSKIMQE